MTNNIWQCNPHVLLVCQSIQGHLNPAIELAKNLIRAGTRVTLTSTVSGFHKLKSLPSIQGLSFASFSDGHDDDNNAIFNVGYVHDIKRVGSETLTSLIKTMSENDNKVKLLVYTLYLPFAGAVVRELNVPCALFFIQSATCLPLFKWGDLPTFVLPTSPYFTDMSYVYKYHLQLLEQDPNTWVLVNNLDGLEPDSMRSIKNAVVVGPLVSSSFSGTRGSYFEWLDSKQENSVAYVSFGSLAKLTKTQKQELLIGLIESGRQFLLVLRDAGEEEDVEIKELKENVGDKGLIVGWCAQLKVLRHPAIRCFVTHCGWNSTLESLVVGVPVVACPQFSDQTTNAKMVEEVWGNGVRAVLDEEIVVRSDEIKRCLNVVMGGGDRAEEIRKNAEKWKKVAAESVKDGGLMQTNLKLFLESVATDFF
ncbi:UDP-glycosyltransferase 75C1-like protein [Tanacetum coccineum]